MSATTTSSSRTEAMPGLKGKGVLVTGGTSGNGQAIAVRFAEHGANVAINYLGEPDEATDTEQQVQACVAKVQQEASAMCWSGATSAAKRTSSRWLLRRARCFSSACDERASADGAPFRFTGYCCVANRRRGNEREELPCEEE